MAPCNDQPGEGAVALRVLDDPAGVVAAAEGSVKWSFKVGCFLKET